MTPSGLITSKCRPAPNNSHLHDSDGSGRALTTLLRTSVVATKRTPPRCFHLMLQVALDQRDARLRDRCSPPPVAANAQKNRRERAAHPRLHLAPIYCSDQNDYLCNSEGTRSVKITHTESRSLKEFDQ